MPVICVTLALIGLDIGTGVLGAIVNGTLSSKVARQGLMHKSAYLACILLALILDNAQLIIDLQMPVNLQKLACGYICMVEVFSITENLAIINPELRDSRLLQLFIGTARDDTGRHGTTPSDTARHTEEN